MKRKVFNGGQNKGCITIETIDSGIIHCHTSIFVTKFKFGEILAKFDNSKKKVIKLDYNINITNILFEKLYSPTYQFQELCLDDIFDIISMMDQYLVFGKEKISYELATYIENCLTFDNFLELYKRSKIDKMYKCLTSKIEDYFKNILVNNDISTIKKNMKIDNSNILLLLELLLNLLEIENNSSRIDKFKKIMQMLKQM